MKRKLEEPKFEPLYKRVNYVHLDEIVNYKRDYNELKKIEKKIDKRVYPKEIVQFYGRGSQFKAIGKRNSSYPGCPIFGQEIIQKNQKDKKYFNYFLMTYDDLADIIEKSNYPRFNENIEGISKLCLDIDIDSDKIKIDKQALVDFTNRLYNLIYFINKNLKSDFDLDIKFKTTEPYKNDVIILNASRVGVISFHVIYRNVYFINIIQVGIYLSKILSPILKKKESSFLPIIEFMDFNIYRENHLVRTYFSVKQNDSTTRFLLQGVETQKFKKQILLDSLICHIDDIWELDCINVESTPYLSESYHYTQFKHNKNIAFGIKKKRVYINQRRNINFKSGNQKDFNLNKEPFKKFYEVCNKIFKNYDKNFDPKDFFITRIYLSDFGSQPFQIPGSNTTIVRGKSFCIEINGEYCPLHKRFHKNAKTKSYYYFPFSDTIYLERNKWRKVWNKIIKLKNPKLKNRFIFNLYYRCNFRNANEGCLKINIKEKCKDLVNEFLEIHNNVLKELSK